MLILDLPQLLDPSEVAAWLGVPVRRLERLVQAKEIPAIWVCGQLRFDAAQLRAWLNGRVGRREINAGGTS